MDMIKQGKTHKHNLPIIISILCILSLCYLLSLPQHDPNSPVIKGSDFLSDDDLLIDKVYTFHSGSPSLIITNLTFEREFTYNIKMAVVTDEHECHMEVNLFDPEGDLYELFSSQEPMTYDEYFDIPFGAALSGVYNLNFTKLDGPNLNIHIIIRKGELCFREFVSGDANHVYEIRKFARIPSGKSYRPYYYFKDQWCYHIYLCRVSPISANRSNQINLDHNVVDPSVEGISFPIYTNHSLGQIWDPRNYEFGTAMAGEYLLNFTFYQDPEFINVMFLITDEGRLAAGEDAGSINETTAPTPIMWVPLEAQVGISLGVGALVLVGLIIMIYTKRHSNI